MDPARAIEILRALARRPRTDHDERIRAAKCPPITCGEPTESVG